MPKWDPKDYAQNSAPQFALARELIERLGLKGNESVLDVGCGDGKITVEVAKLVPAGRAVGIDASQEMIGYARSTFPPSAHPNLEFQVMDAREITFSGRFDLAMSNSALHWVKDHRPVLEGIARALKPGGRTMLQMGGKSLLEPMTVAVAKIIGDPRWKEAFNNFSSPFGLFGPEEYREWVAAAGLAPLRVELVPRSLDLPDREAMLGWMRTTWMFLLDRIAPRYREAFLLAAIDSYLALNPPGPDGKICIPTTRLIVEALKGSKSA